MKYRLKTHSKKILADTLTPVNIYLKLRDIFAGSILLESSDYHGHENSRSFICCDPIASFTVADGTATLEYPDKTVRYETLSEVGQLTNLLEDFKNSFDLEPTMGAGLFGYTSYDAVRHFEDVEIDQRINLIPEIIYKLYRYVITIDHFSNDLTLLEHTLEVGEQPNLDRIEQIIVSNRFSTYKFKKTNGEVSNFQDDEFLKIIEQAKQHCFRGDVFQMVLSRRFESGFNGDEFNVYRALRSINPSPYLFYFDYGSFKLFGSSPEAQLQIDKGKAHIYPIAGTFRRTGNDQEDQALAEKLAGDEKENAEHVMLVDLARNDMSRNTEDVTVEVFKEIQFYSHIIHLVSKVTGTLTTNTPLMKIVGDTFPAGTLSGAPKHKAMTLINQYENVNRGFYGGAIGFIGFDNSFNHAIMIRTFLSHENRLIYQAGAGIVSKSKAESELEEVNNKLAALRKAITMAETL